MVLSTGLQAIHFQALFQGLADAVLVYTVAPDGQPETLLDANDAARSWLGFTKKQFARLAPDDVLTAAEGTLAEVHARHDDAAPVRFDGVLRSRDGERMPVTVHATRHRFDGQTLVVAVCRNATPSTPALLRRDLIDHATVGLAVMALDGHFLFANPYLIALLGYTPEDWKTMTFVFLTHPDDRMAEMDHVRRLQFGEIASYTVEKRLLCKDGRALWVTNTVSLVRDDDGEPAHFVCVIEDASARHIHSEQAEQGDGLYRLLTGFDLELVLRMTSDSILTYLSPASRSLLGKEPAAFIDRPLFDFVHPDDLPLIRRTLEVVRTEGNIRSPALTFRMQGKSGAALWVEGLFQHVHEDNAPDEIVALIRNVSKRKDVEAALRKAKEAAETANLAKSQFLADMSHELRTPLNAVIGYSEMLQEEAADAGLDTFDTDLQKIHQAGHHLLLLINDVLDLSKLEAGRIELSLSTFDIGALVREVVQTVRPTVGGLDFDVRCPDAMGTMHADQMRVRQCLLNLLSNAIKFTEAGSVQLKVRREKTLAGERILFRVEDTGVGMSDAQIAHIFEPFVQAHSGKTKGETGTGLGLAITQRFAQIMGGEVSVESAPGDGSSFTLRLPAAVTEEMVAEAAQSPALAPPTSQSTVLVIDDASASRDQLMRLFQAEGFQTITASAPRESLQLARQHQPFAITMNVQMPEMDGWSALAAFKADPALANIPLFPFTLAAEERLDHPLSAAALLTKPVDRSRLRAVIKPFFHQNDPHVLVVDDDELSRGLARRTLEREGWSVVEAENGREALKRMSDHLPDVILLDLLMPWMNGFEFVESLRKNQLWRQIPFIVISGKELTERDRRRLQSFTKTMLIRGEGTAEELLKTVCARVIDTL